LVIDAGGSVRCIHGEALDLRELGTLKIIRASHVEPDAEGVWRADMTWGRQAGRCEGRSAAVRRFVVLLV
jgi:hypothetical protein